MKHFKTRSALVLLGSACLGTQAHAQVQVASATPSAAPAVTAGGGVAPVPAAEGAALSADCGDVLSAVLHVDQQNDMPCWANIRSTERWNVAEIPDGSGLHGTDSLRLPRRSSSRLNFAGGGLVATDFVQGDSLRAYGGELGTAGFIDKARWQLAAEDVGALAATDDASGGGKSFVGLNRAAIRFGAQPTQRLTWRASATNTFGADALRLLAPQDERRIGTGDSAAQLTVADAVTYGLHTGNVVDEQEDGKVQYEQTRRSNWEFAAGHTLLHYADDGVTVQAVRGRAEFLHAWNDHTALGVFGHTERQDGPANCTLTGGGVRSISTWGERASLNVSGAVSAADAACGQRVTFTGDAAFSVRATDRTTFALTANRGLSDGVLEHLALLNTAVVGVHHGFASLVDFNLSAAGVLGNDVFTQRTATGTFVSVGLTYPVGSHLMGETSLRHVEVTPTTASANRTILVSTLWFTPRSRARNER